MPILSLSAGRVTAIWGHAYRIEPDGFLKPLHVGDQITGWQQILTDQKGIVEIEPKALSPKLLALIQAADADHAIARIESQAPEAAPAAGLEGGSGSLLPGLRVDRVHESVSPQGQIVGQIPETVDRAITPYQLPAEVAAQQLDASGSGAIELPPNAGPFPLPGETPVPVALITLSEKGLVGDTATYPVSQTQALDLSPALDPGHFSLQPPSTSLFAAGGQALIWLSDGHGGLVARTAADGPDYVQARWDASTQQVTVTLTGPLQHATGADVLNFDLHGVVPSGGVNQPAADVFVAVQDDAPHLMAPPPLVAQAGTNLMVVLDTSSDMAPSLNGMTRLQATLQALGALIDRYAEVGPVAVRLVQASDTPHLLGSTWLSSEQAKSLVASLYAHGDHAFDRAFTVAEDAFSTTDGRIDGAHNVSYFFVGGPSGSDALGVTEASAWTQFLNDHQITSHVIGVGAGVTESDWASVAYDGVAHAAIDPVVVTSPSALHQIEPDHAVSIIKGSLLDTVAMGADGLGGVVGITVGDQHHSVAEAVQGILTITTTLGGTFSVDVHSGQYSYQPPADATDFALDPIQFTLADKDGDPVSSTLNAVVNRFNVVNSTYFNDTLVGHHGTDVFTWHLYDVKQWGTTSSVDHVKGFEFGEPRLAGGDVLDLRDLLQGEHAAAGGDALSHFIEVDSNAAGTTLHISSGGHFYDGVPAAAIQDHAIVLDGVDLRAGLGLTADTSSAVLLNHLLAQGQLRVDP